MFGFALCCIHNIYIAAVLPSSVHLTVLSRWQCCHLQSCLWCSCIATTHFCYCHHRAGIMLQCIIFWCRVLA